MNARSASPRRVSVELRFTGAPPPTLPAIAGRALHQYWSLLAPHFRLVLLPPQWRAEGTGLAWSWRETAANPPPSAAEFTTLRKRLTGAQRSLAAAAQDAAPTPEARNLVSLAQLQATTAEVTAALLSLPDAALSAYVARTDTGLMLHSWGLPAALTPAEPGTALPVINAPVAGVELPDRADPITRRVTTGRRRRQFAALFILLLLIIAILIASSRRDLRRDAVFSPTPSSQSAPPSSPSSRAPTDPAGGARTPGFPEPSSIGLRAITGTPHPARFSEGPSGPTVPDTARAPTGHAGTPPPQPEPTPSNGTAKNSPPIPTTALTPQPSSSAQPSAPRADLSRDLPLNAPEIQTASPSLNPSQSSPTSTPTLLTGTPEEKPSPLPAPPATSNPTPDSAPPAPSAVATPRSALSLSTQASTTFTRRLRFHLSPWQPRLLRDTILPTQPTRVRETESIDALRARLFREQQARLPISFQPPAIAIGFALELPTGVAAHWQTLNGSAPLIASVRESHAEITLPKIPPHATAPTTISLLTAHRELARVTFDLNGEATLTLVSGVRARPWITLTIREKDPAPLTWKILRGPPASANWQSRQPSLDSPSYRLDPIPESDETGLHQRTLALLDETTGWALITELSTAIEIP